MLDTIDCFDEYGFAVFKKESEFATETKINEVRVDTSPLKTMHEWQKIFSSWIRYTQRGLGIKLLNVVKKGVPNSIRGELWTKLLEVEVLKHSSQFKYQEQTELLRNQLLDLGISEFNTVRAQEVLCKDISKNANESEIEESEIQNLRQIFLDLNRTFPTHILFLGDSQEAIQGRAALFRILALYSKYNPEVGYCQGMSFIAGMLCMMLSEEQAFWCLVVLLQKSKYLYGYFDNKLEKIQRHALVFDQLLKQREPELWNHLHCNGVHPLMYVTQWFMCLYTSLPCWDTILAIWDLVLLQGVVVIFETAVALMQVMKSHLLAATDVNTLILSLQKPPIHCLRRSILLPAIWKVKIQRWEIDSLLAVVAAENQQREVKPRDMGTSTGFTKKLTLIREKFKRKKVDNRENKFMKAFTKIFNGNQRQSINGESVIDNNVKLEMKDSFMSPMRPSNCSGSTVADISRLRRLKTVSGKFESSDSPCGGVRNLVGSPADQRWAFQQFSHQLPLRQSASFTTHSSLTSPETELRSVGNKQTVSNSISSLDSSFVSQCNNQAGNVSQTSWEFLSPTTSCDEYFQSPKTSNTVSSDIRSIEISKTGSRLARKLRLI